MWAETSRVSCFQAQIRLGVRGLFDPPKAGMREKDEIEWPYVANVIIERNEYGWWKTKAYDLWTALPHLPRKASTESGGDEADRAEG